MTENMVILYFLKTKKMIFKRSKNKEILKIEKIYEKELKRKDKLIEELRKENELLMKSALKGADKLEDMKLKLNKKIKK